MRITVDDEGEGIPAEMRRRVFTKFWKGGTRGGSGLGLYIVSGLTKVHGGTVTHRRRPRRRRPHRGGLAVRAAGLRRLTAARLSKPAQNLHESPDTPTLARS